MNDTRMNDTELLHRLTKYASPASVCTVSASYFPLWRVGAGVPSAGNTDGVGNHQGGKLRDETIVGFFNRLFPFLLLFFFFS